MISKSISRDAIRDHVLAYDRCEWTLNPDALEGLCVEVREAKIAQPCKNERDRRRHIELRAPALMSCWVRRRRRWGD